MTVKGHETRTPESVENIKGIKPQKKGGENKERGDTRVK
jgi:hypothetical protein